MAKNWFDFVSFVHSFRLFQ